MINGSSCELCVKVANQDTKTDVSTMCIEHNHSYNSLKAVRVNSQVCLSCLIVNYKNELQLPTSGMIHDFDLIHLSIFQ